MCGITGWISYDADLRNEKTTVEAMVATMACRGPDDSGVWLAEHAALGHRRLAVIDPSGGRQPMNIATPGGNVAIVYSGETYNFAELREELRGRGHTFTTRSDTEVVVRGYVEWGIAVAERLNGMYAFAIWDSRAQKLVMIRDRMGIKPLYYYVTREGVLFGSEAKAILANPLVCKTVNTNGLRELVAFTKKPGSSLWKGVSEVEPGSIVTIDASGVSTRTYWRLTTHRHTDNQDGSIEHVRELLTDIVDRQLVADVPRCVLLSGGLDSSAITGLAAERLRNEGEQLHTFSVDFPGQEENFQPDGVRGTPDAPYIRDVAKLVGSAHQDIMVKPLQHADPAIRRAVINAWDSPIGYGDVDKSLYLLFQAIRNESTVALSGESADEVFGGYRWFHDEAVRSATDTFPWLASMSLVAGRNDILHPSVRNLLNISEYTSDEYESAAAKVEHLHGDDRLERRMRTISNLFLTRFVRMLLDCKDRMSMAVGLEVRVPFCDHRLVDYAYNAPWSLKTFDGREKSLLRHAAKHVLPDSVTWRAKSGFPSSQARQYGIELQRQARDILADRNSRLFDLIDRRWLLRAVHARDYELSNRTRLGLDWVLDLYHWLDMYKPTISLD